MYETKPYFYGTGRRKDSVARVRVRSIRRGWKCAVLT